MNFKNESFAEKIRDILVITLSVFMILISGCAKKTPLPPLPPKVTVAQPVQRIVNDHLELVGNTQAINTVQLVARVPGYLEKIFFHDGQSVKKGELLFLIQQDTYKAKLEQAEGQVLAQKSLLAYAQNELTRYTELFAQKAAPQTDVDNWRYQHDSAEANLKVAEANRDLAKLDLSYTEVVAPFNGRIDRRQQDPGNLVGANGNTVLAQLTQVDPIYVYFSISDFDLVRLLDSMHSSTVSSHSQNWPVRIGLVDEDGYPHQGSIDFSASSLTATTGTLLMRGVLTNPEEKILPGSYARVEVPLKKKTALLVPDIAIGNDQQGSFVFVVNEKNIVERRSIKPGFLVDTLRVIDNGLSEKDWVIINGLQRAIPHKSVSPEKIIPEFTDSSQTTKDSQVAP